MKIKVISGFFILVCLAIIQPSKSIGIMMDYTRNGMGYKILHTYSDTMQYSIRHERNSTGKRSIDVSMTKNAMTLEQLKNSGKMARKSCQSKTGAPADKLDRMQVGKFDAEPDPKVKCYVKCVHTMMQVMKKGKYDADKCIAQMMKVLPVDVREMARKGVEHCRHAGDKLTDPCDYSYVQVTCLQAFEPQHFYFP